MTGTGRWKAPALAAALLAALVLAGPVQLRAADGALDPFFDGDGSNKLGYSPGTTSERGYGVAVQRSGRILVAGYTGASDPSYGGFEMNVFGLRRDGGLDAGFGFSGARRVGTANDDFGNTVAVQRDGKIVIAGTTTGLVGFDFLVCRLRAGGGVDTGFGAGGCRRVALPNAFGPRLALQSDGKIVLAGVSGLGDDFTVVRLTTGGKLDRAFGTDGVATVNFAGWDMPYAVAIQPDGKILVAGVTEALTHDVAVARLRRGGGLDGSFGVGGRVVLDLDGDTDEAHGMALQPDGKIVLAGETYVTAFGDYDMAVVRLDAAGNLDPGFGGGDGWTPVHFGGTRDDDGRDVVVLRDGRIVVGGTTSLGLADDFALAWLNPDGSPDATAGLGGLVITDVEGDGSGDQGEALAFQSDGKLVLAGNTTDFSGDVAVARYLVDLPWNGGFERAYAAAGKADLWRLRRTLAADGRDCTESHGGSCSLKLRARRANRAVKRVEQWTGAGGKQGDAYAVSLWTKTAGVAGAGAFQVQVTFRYADGTSGRFRLRPADGTHDWEESTRTVTADKAYRNVKVAVVYGRTAGTVWLDDLVMNPQQ